MSFIRDIINFILPPRCVVCGKVLDTDKGLCDKCISHIEFINGAICQRCGQPLGELSIDYKKMLCGSCLRKRRHLFRYSRSACVYDEFSKKLILDFKFHDKTDLASFLAKMIYVAGKELFTSDIDVIIPVPLHHTRLLLRKYNQSALLAKELGKLSGIKVSYNAVIKNKITRPQVECCGVERLKNVKGSFTVKKPEELRGKRVLLVDDVMTTGSTLKECALVIKKAQPKSIDNLTVARVIS